MSRSQDTPPAVGLLDIFADYAAMRPSRFRRTRTGLASWGAGANIHFRSEADCLRLMENARDMDRNDAVIGQAIDRVVVNIMQDGFGLDPDTGDKAVNDALWDRWEAWTADPSECDDSGRFGFHDIGRLALRSMLVDGDDIVILKKDGRTQFVEGHRLRTPSSMSNRGVVFGVRVDDRGRPVEYWITKEDVAPSGAVSRVNEIDRQPAFDDQGRPLALHIVDPKRYTQTRGVTIFAPVFDIMGNFEDLNFANVVKQQIAAAFCIFREMAANTPPAGATLQQNGSREVVTDPDGTTRRVDAVHPGMIVQGRPGEKLAGFAPNIPGTGYFEHVNLILKMFGATLGLPLMMILLDSGETNFSGWRGAYTLAQNEWRRLQRLMRDRLYRQVYRWKASEWADDDPVLGKALATLGERYFKHKWAMPSWPYVDPLKDIQADQLRVTSLLGSPRAVLAERGLEWETSIDETVSDNEYAIVKAIEASKRIEQKHGVFVHWSQVLRLIEGELIRSEKDVGSAGEDNPGGGPARKPMGAGASGGVNGHLNGRLAHA